MGEGRGADDRADAYTASLEAQLDEVRRWSQKHDLPERARRDLEEIIDVGDGVILARRDNEVRDEALRIVADLLLTISAEGTLGEVARGLSEKENQG